MCNIYFYGNSIFQQCTMKLLTIIFILTVFQRVAIESKKLRKIGNHTYEDERIIGGTLVKDIKEFPFVASLIRYEGFLADKLCGASIIAKFWAVTAAHCLQNTSHETSFSVNFNSTTWSAWGGPYSSSVEKWYTHELFGTEGPTDYDVAVVYVSKEFSKEFFIAVVTSNFQYVTNSKATIVGWGSTSNNEQYVSKDLFYANVELQDWNECKKYYAHSDRKITKRMFCAGDEGRDACSGDSGGPIYQYSKKKRVLIGVVSWGSGQCAESKYSGVYTNLAVVSNWIKNRTRMNANHKPF